MFKIISDSACDLSQAYIEKNNIDISNVKAYELADNVNIYVQKNGDSEDKIMMLEYGAYVYARYVDKYLDNTALKNLMTAMYHYCNAATEYANIY